MIDSNSNSTATNISGLLGVSFVVLKLTGMIGWSWWYVTMPFWGGTVLMFTLFSGFLLAWGVVEGVKSVVGDLSNRKRLKRNEILNLVESMRKAEVSMLECPYMQEGLAEVERICGQ